MYRELAEIYDQAYRSKDYESESRRLTEIITAHDRQAKTLVDVACGTGGHLEHLQHRFSCEGLDLSSEMVGLAQAKLPSLKFHVANMADFDLGKRFDAVVCLFSAVGHLESVERLNAAVGRMAAHLEPHGMLVVEPWIDPTDWLVCRSGLDEPTIASMSFAEPVDRGRLVMELLIGTKAGVTRLKNEHEMAWFTRAEYEASFRKAGLSVNFDSTGLTGRGLYVGTLTG